MPPAFARRSLVRRFSSLRWNGEFDRVARRVLLFPDTFANYFEPEVGAATIELLQKAGREVTFGPPGLRCCGRPLISNGLLDQAVANARHNVERLHDWASRDGTIIACEPSCILTIKDDYPALLKGQLRAQAETVARRCLTFEEYFDSIFAQDTSGYLDYKAGPRKVLVQAHCHQRSLVGTGPMEKLLRSIPGTGDRSSTQAAAAWLGRSATRPSITRFRG